MIEKIIEIIFPISCGICGKLNNKYICPKCYYQIKNELKFKIVKEDKFKLYFIGHHENTIRKLLLKFKFSDSAYLANLFIEILCKNNNFVEKIKQYDAVIPVPMYCENKKKRGYNQTELLAKEIERKIEITCISNVLIKNIQNKKQSELGEKERKENVKNVYKLENEELIYNKKILLLDDIFTTGSTVKECIKTINKAKVKKIDALVIAKRN